MRRVRVLSAVGIAVGAGVLALASGGWIPIMLGFIAAVIAADLLVPDFHTELFHELPESKREHLRRPRRRR